MLPDKMPSTLNLNDMLGQRVPSDWKIINVLGDIVMAEYVDENEFGEILRDGIYLKNEVSQKMWRVAKVLNVGTNVKTIKVDDLIMFPADRGVPMINFKKQKLIFLNEERIFAVVDKV